MKIFLEYRFRPKLKIGVSVDHYSDPHSTSDFFLSCFTLWIENKIFFKIHWWNIIDTRSFRKIENHSVFFKEFCKGTARTKSQGARDLIQFQKVRGVSWPLWPRARWVPDVLNDKKTVVATITIFFYLGNSRRLCIFRAFGPKTGHCIFRLRRQV